MTDSPTTPEREAVARLADTELEVIGNVVWLKEGGVSFHPAPEPFSVGQSCRVEPLVRLSDALAKADAILARGCPEGWRPIETAPKDGTKIVGMNARGEVFRVWWFLFEEGHDWQDDWDSEQRPTHWMPLPAAPQPISGGE